ncbi:MAG: glutamate--cysteine ligase [Cellvibrionales bacterium]|nr:glutamate--cysteine ligase [Cellvibrionales bacterium]
MATLLETLKDIEQNPAFISSLATQFRGIERESLRTAEDHLIAQTPHPKSLGSALSHSQITTDFSEAQLEFITQVHPRIDTCLYDLYKIHQFAYMGIHNQNEVLWAGSMPPELPDNRPIPIAQFGTSNVAKMKSTYREGLKIRYNDKMQTISGIHYNFSLSDKFFVHYQKYLGNTDSAMEFKTEQYFGLIRNFQRVAPLFVYLFGATPAFDESFLPKDHYLHSDVLKLNHTCYLPYATSLRMSDIGYTSEAQKGLYVCYNHLDNYIDSLRLAIKEPYSRYEALGLLNSQGNPHQLNTSLLQIENEFYSPIRPKRVTASGEAPVNALARAGVEYVEVRCVDIDPFKPMGLDEETLIFLDLLLLACVLMDSPDFSLETCQMTQDNLQRIIHYGRQPDLTMRDARDNGLEKPFKSLAMELIDMLEPLAQFLDKLQAKSPYQDNLKQQRQKIDNPELTPSAKTIDALREYGDYTTFIHKKNAQWHAYFSQSTLSEISRKAFEDAAVNSLVQQSIIEKNDTVDFTHYLENYYSQY